MWSTSYLLIRTCCTGILLHLVPLMWLSLNRHSTKLLLPHKVMTNMHYKTRLSGQHAGSLGLAVMLARSHDFSRYSRLLDLGGGSGAFAIEAVKCYPGLSAVMFDLPQVVAVTEQIIEEYRLTSRITCPRVVWHERIRSCPALNKQV